MIIADWYEKGVLFGVKYQLTNVGNGLLKHRHPEHEQHNTICLAGKCVLFGPTLPTTIINAGDISDYDSTQDHSIVALVPNTIILNLCLYGKPESYRELVRTHYETNHYPELPPELQELINNRNGD